jgi:hypothetical protein
MINFYKYLKMSVISEEVIARDIEEFEKQKHLLNTPVQVMQESYWLNQSVSHDPDWLNGIYSRLQEDVTDQLNYELFITFYCKKKNKTIG